LNPNIDFDNSPFVVQQELAEWKRLFKDGEEIPRRAGVSSFGAGGVNAHVMIEEYENEAISDQRSAISVKPQIIVLSAKNEDRLKAYAQAMLKYVNSLSEEEVETRNSNPPDQGRTRLENISFTLQVGREAMKERLGTIVKSTQELSEKLKGFLSGKSVEDFFRGQVKRSKETLSVIVDDDDMGGTIDAWIAKGKYAKLLSLWVNGLNFDWNRLYDDDRPRRICLPTYPFARERYWIPEGQKQRAEGMGHRAGNGAGVIHPLLHENTSDLSEQRFSSTFTGEEFFLADHVVKGRRVLPGVAYLEMARAAVEKAAGVLKDEQTGIRLKNVVWARPVIVESKPVQLHTGLFPEESGEIAYEIYSISEDDDAERIVHCQGSALPGSVSESHVLDIEALKSGCDQTILLSDKCYEMSKAVGIGYDPGRRGIEKVYAGSDQMLAKLSLPDLITNTQDRFVLHPSLMDAALQASGLMLTAVDMKPALPVALETLEIFAGCTQKMWAFVRKNGGGKVQTLDIDLCDETGKVCARMKGLSSRVLEDTVGSEGASASYGTLLLEPVWKEKSADGEVAAPDYGRHLVMLCGLDDSIRAAIETRMPGVHCIRLQSKDNDIAKRFESYAEQVFVMLRSIIEEKPEADVRVQIVVSVGGEKQLFSGLSGLLKTVRMENSKIIGQLIVSETDPEIIVKRLIENKPHPMDTEIRYQGDRRLVLDWKEIETSMKVPDVPWKSRGIYLITGGAGGLGLIFAKEIADNVSDATLILTGRSPLDKEKEAKLKVLEASGTTIQYRQADVTQKDIVADLLQSIQEDYGNLNGIIHSAGVIRDNFILKKTETEFQEVLAPKVSGLVNLDESGKDLPLDFFILFSSGAGAVGNVGQADYACANAFMDAFAAYRNELVRAKQRRGRTLSIDWPLWKDGGMRVDKETEKMMRQSTGMIPMGTQAGIRALYEAFAAGGDQVMAMEGDVKRFQATLSGQLSVAKRSKTTLSKSLPPEDVLREKTLHRLKALFAETTKLGVDAIDAQEPLESYGIDSVMIMRLNRKLADVFGELSKTVFYEYLTIKALSDYLVSDYPQACTMFCGLEDSIRPTTDMRSVDTRVPDDVPMPGSLKAFKKVKARFAIMDSGNGVREPIAIIGISGRYPQAKTIDAYWENLKGGKDCITEIPEDRWSLSGFYHPDPQEAVARGKSYSKWGGFVEKFADFDPQFFNISPREAINMDPQERLFVQSSWEVFEDAGYTRQQLEAQYNGRVGVFAGITKTGFNLYGPDLWRQGEKVYPHTSFSSVANRISYLLNLHGPSMPIDTMCSSSLTAIHEACEHLYQQECDMAIAGGVNLYLHPSSYSGLCAQHMLSSDGQCKSFGKGGDGFVPGEGVGVVLLKPLSRAVEDRDHIYALIRGTSINHGGKTHGYTVPNPTAQGELIRKAFDRAGVDARTVSYVEAHGTGTTLGDPIEITGLTQAFRKDTEDTQFCAIGSVKSNIGHLEAAAGIAGVAKIVLQMKHQKIAPSLHAKELNPNIDFAKTPFVVQQELSEWRRPEIEIDGESREYPRIAGLSSFGAGGSNAHVVIEEYKDEAFNVRHSAFSTNPQIIVLSAKNEERLKVYAEKLLDFILGEPNNLNLTGLASVRISSHKALEDKIQTHLAEILQVDQADIEVTERFTDYGVESFHQSRLFEKLQAMFTFEIKAKEVIEKDSIAHIAADLLKNHSEHLEPAGVKIQKEDEKSDSTKQTAEKFKIESARPRADKNSKFIIQNFAYTLQVGREAMEERLGIIVDSMEELGEKLKGFVEDRDDMEGLYRGQVKQSKETLVVFTDDEDLKTLIVSWVAKGKYSKLLSLWVKGLNFDWNKLYGDEKPCRISLPTYPFAGDRYWIPEVTEQRAACRNKALPRRKGMGRGAKGSLTRRSAAKSESVYSDIPDKPTGISLGPLSTAQILPIKSAAQPRPAVPLSPTDGSLPQPGVSDESQSIVPVDAAVSSESLLGALKISLAETLYMKPSKVDEDRNFVDMGLDSIIGVEWIRTINKQYGTTIPATRVYDYPTLCEFAGFLKEELNKTTPALLGDVSGQGTGSTIKDGDIPDPTGGRFDATRHALSPVTGAESIHSDISGKPKNISLGPLLNDPVPATKPAAQTQQPASLSSTDNSFSPLGAGDEFQSLIDTEADISSESLLGALKISLAETLYMKPSKVDEDRNFVDMGLDSIIGVEWIRTINKQYGTTIPATRVYDYPTLHEFTGFLKDELNKTKSVFLDDLIRQVHEKTLNVEQADRLFNDNHFLISGESQ
jgi:acyl transferase domain-containing protein/acyl carrier protein